jgi:flagellar biosynthesis protein FliQ
MTLGFVVSVLKDSVMQILLLSAPILLVSMVVGLIISIIQATTSIQEQTLTFVPKIAAILVTLMLLGPWMFTSLAQFTTRLFERIPDLAG